MKNILNTKGILEKEIIMISIKFDQNIILKSSCCYDFNTAAEIFGKWTLTGMLNPGLWWHQWDDGEDHFELTEVY